MRALLIDDRVRKTVDNLMAHAGRNILSMDELLDTKNKDKPPVGDDPNHRIYIDEGYRIVFSLEAQKEMVAHLSVSVDTTSALPSIEAVREIIKLFGFNEEIDEYRLKVEQIDDDHSAINVWKIMES